MTNPLFQKPKTPLQHIQTAFKLPHLNATFFIAFQPCINQTDLKKLRAPTENYVFLEFLDYSSQKNHGLTSKTSVNRHIGNT